MTYDEWMELRYSDRLEITEFIFKKITEGPSSFRRLIYNRLGFTGMDYEILYRAGGMDITNAMHEHWRLERNYELREEENDRTM